MSKEQKNNITRGVVISSDRKEKTEGSFSDSLTQSQRINVLEERAKELEYKAKNIGESLERSERNQDKAINFIMGIAGIIVVAFFLALIPFLFDYYKDNAERYEKFTRKIDNLDMRIELLETKKIKK